MGEAPHREDSTGTAGATLTISNLNETAALSVTGGPYSGSSGAAGIGGGDQQKGGTIIIRGGTISATAGTQTGNCGGAGIGGGWKQGVISVIISGGKATATASKEGAGIGAGRSGSNGYVEISGGTVSAPPEGRVSATIPGRRPCASQIGANA